MLLERGAEFCLDGRRKGAMHYALTNASCTPSLVHVLQQNGAPLDKSDINNMSPLHYCVKFSHKIIAGQLINAGVPIDLRVHRQSWFREVSESTSGMEKFSLPASGSDATGLTPLHFAALTGNLTMTEFLLEHGADPNALSDYGETPLHLALRTAVFGTRYRDDWTDSYLRVEHPLRYTDSEKHDFNTSLAMISFKREGVLNALLSDLRISLTVTDYKGESPLHCIRYGEPESVTVVRQLVLRGADPSHGNRSQQTPLHFASKSGDHESVKALLLLGAKAALVDGSGLNALHYAAQSGNHETMMAILKIDEAAAANLIASKDKSGQNVLHQLLYTSPVRCVETVQSLLDEGAHGSELDDSGLSPLATYIKYFEEKSSEDENFEDESSGDDSFDDESLEEEIDIEICRLLLGTKETASCIDSDGHTLGHLLAMSTKFEVPLLSLLLEYGVDLSKKDCDGRTLLHHAAMHDTLTEESLGFLTNIVSIQADEEDTHGRTALQYATELVAKERSKKSRASKYFDPAPRGEGTRNLLQELHDNRTDKSCPQNA
ncbi:ankyrin repeat-containing domain protein [Phaeosphaeria sp. MPI-PUGE-AT-0046c]|nr:ankyrin repeat-containing domain protein [Phaeosphaeria sp. MPI-PUGE-AT-0046c]